MSEQYLIVNTKILPDFYAKVVEARDLVEQHKVNGSAKLFSASASAAAPIINIKIRSFLSRKTRAAAKLC